MSELDIQKAIEASLDSIEDGLQYIQSFVQIGSGIIDTLATDEDGNAVVIEYKKPGDFDKDALFQLMGYYAWCSRGNNSGYIRDVVRKKKADYEGPNEIRLMAVVSEIDDQVKNACWALEPDVKLVSYTVAGDSAGKVVVVPSIVLDTSVGREKAVKPPKTEDDHLTGHDNLRELYKGLREWVQKSLGPEIKFNPAPQDYIGLIGKNKKMFVGLHFKKKWIRADILLLPKEVGSSPRLVAYGPNSDWSYIHVESLKDLDEELVSWFKLAHAKQM